MSKKPIKQNIQEKRKSKQEFKDYFKNDWLNLLLLFFVWFLILSQLVTGSAWLHDDFPYVFYPGKFLAAVSLSDGVFPFWNPFSFGGMPFFSDPQIAIFYPFNYLFKFFVTDGYLSPFIVQVIFLIHYFFLSVFCYYLGKELKFNNFASLIFGVMFTYSSYMIIHMIHMNVIETVMWLPLLFLLLLKFIGKKKYIYIVIAGLIMAMSILAGYPQVFFYNSVFLSLFLFYQMILAFGNKDFIKLKFISLGLVIFFVIAISVSCVQLLPTYILTQNSSRSDVGYEFAKQGSVHPLDIITLFVPKVFGTFNWNESANEQSYWSVKSNGGHQEGAFMYTVSTLYLTLLPVIILVPVIRFSLSKKEYKKPVLYTLAFSLIVILFSFGGNFFVHWIFFTFVPLFNKFRNPGHITYIFSFCMLLISAFGLNEMISNKNEMNKYFSRKYFLTIAALIIFVFAMTNIGIFKSKDGPSSDPQIYSWITKQVNIFFFLSMVYLLILYLYFSEKLSKTSFQLFLLLIVFLDIYLFAHNQNNGSRNPQEMYSQNSKLINQIKEDQKDELFRVNMRDGRNLLFQRYQGALDRIQLMEGINVLTLTRTFPVNKEGSSTQMLDLMNVKYKIKVDEKNKSNNTLIANEGYLPRARMFYDVKVIEDENALKDYMKSNDFDYRKTLVLEKNLPNINLPKPDTNVKINSTVRVTEYGLNKIKLDVDTDENGFLFLSEVFYPDWKALADGKETEIYRTDFSLRSIYLEKGKHSVEFLYESKEFNWGSRLSIGAFSICLLLIGIMFFRDKKNSGKD